MKNSGKRKKNNGNGGSKGTSKGKKDVKESNSTSKTSTSKGRVSSPKSGSGTTASSSIGAIHFLLAIISLAAGVFTPPALKYASSSEFIMSKINMIPISILRQDDGDDGVVKKSMDDVMINADADISSNNDKTFEKVAVDEDDDDDDYYDDDDDGFEDEKTEPRYVECNNKNLAMFLHDDPVDGMHILCFEERAGEQVVKLWADSTPSEEDGDSEDFQLRGPSDVDYYVDLVDLMTNELHILPHYSTNTQPWAFFSTNGERIYDELDDPLDVPYSKLTKHGMIVLMEGGQWLWPGVTIGFKRSIEIDTGYHASNNTPKERTAEIETLSLQPLVLSIRNFISDSECTHIQNVAEPSMEYSEVTLMDHDQGRESSDFRTSQSTFVSAGDEILHALDVRTASLTRVPKNHQEYTQVLRYGKGERYTGHVDWFDPKLYQADKGTLDLIQSGKRNRLATVFWYLSDVTSGGETNFPRFDGGPQPRDFDTCGKGLMVKPERGKVIVFYSMTPDGMGDEFSLHAACPVKDGIKWAANKWVWNAPMGYVNDSMVFSTKG